MKTIEICRDTGVEAPVLGLGMYHMLDKVDEPEPEGLTLIDELRQDPHVVKIVVELLSIAEKLEPYYRKRTAYASN